MRQSYLKIIGLLLLFLLSFFIRAYQVGTAPSGTLIDEASFGYNAYSILLTGKDEHGQAMPLTFKAFGDQKLPALVYLTVPFVKIFGLNNLAVRLPSVFAGSLLCIAMFFLLKKMNFNTMQSLIGGLLLAVSPWSIILSRFGYESNIGLFFFSAGLFSLFSYYKNSKIGYAIAAALFLGLTWYSYVPFRVVTTFILFIFLIIHVYKKPRTLSFGKKELIIFVFFVITVLPLFSVLLSKQGTARFNQLSIFSDKGPVLQIDEDRTFCTEKYPKVLCYVIVNKPISYIRELSYRMIHVFSPDFLFTFDNEAPAYQSTDTFGMLPVFFLPFYLIGFGYLLYQLIKKRVSKEEVFVLCSLPIPAVTASVVGEPQMVRLSALLPLLIIVIMYGVKKSAEFIDAYKLKRIFYSLLCLSLVVYGFYYLLRYTGIQTQKEEIAYGTYANKLMKYLATQKDADIYIGSITEGISIYAFVNAVNPTSFQERAVWEKPNAIGFFHPTDFDTIHITARNLPYIYCNAQNTKKRTLFVTNEKFEPTYVKAIKKITTENGVHTLAYVYDVGTMRSDGTDCRVLH
jgi:4-amino-4-deoxy-L-arabinose transferase-like glycosyltransferase